MGWFWSDSTSVNTSAPVAVQSCPVVHAPKESRCPVDHSSPSSCPVPHSARRAMALNPRNNMPILPNAPIRSSGKLISLSTERENSSIPMNEQGEVWPYPSPQQMLNAILRKGYEGTNPEDVPAMVAVHNWINEGSWQEILKWEKKYFP